MAAAGPVPENEPVTVLRKWKPEDGDWYVAQVGDPTISEFAHERATTDVDSFRASLTELPGTPEYFARAIVDPETGELGGNVAATRGDGLAEVHYWLAPDARGRGLATRALLETCDWIGENWPDVERISLSIQAGNDRSVQVALRAGFVHDPRLDVTVEVDGEPTRMEGYARQTAEGVKRWPVGTNGP